jgi:hypothetical protein
VITERADQYGGILQMQLLDDIKTHLLGGRGGVGADGRLREGLAQRAKLAVLRPEVVPPHADAVGLVDRDERQRQRAQHRAEPLGHQPLRGYVQELELPLADPLHGAIPLLRT